MGRLQSLDVVDVVNWRQGFDWRSIAAGIEVELHSTQADAGRRQCFAIAVGSAQDPEHSGSIETYVNQPPVRFLLSGKVQTRTSM